jgi:hypothetical protein
MLRREMERTRKEMEAAIEENRVNKTVFRQELQDWYKARKEKYDMETMSDAHSAEAKAKIIAYRNRMAELAREEAAKLKEELLEKQEEARIEGTIIITTTTTTTINIIIIIIITTTTSMACFMGNKEERGC